MSPSTRGLDEATLTEALPHHDALIVRSATKVTAASLQKADRLAVIGRAGIGIDNIDVGAATDRGIAVMNTPDAGAVTTAEHAVSLMMALARRIPQAHRALSEGRWDKKKFAGVELRGKVLGIVGLGNIGRIVAELARGLGMRIHAYDPFVPASRAPEGVAMGSLEEVLGAADFLTVHVPLLDDTRHLLDARAFSAMKAGSRLICAARGGIVDEAALLQALDAGHLAGAALDVFEKEPLADDSPLRGRDDLVLTPHLGASTAEAQRGVGLAVAEQVVTCLRKGVVLNGINTPRITPAQVATVGPYLSLAQALGRLLTNVFPGKLDSIRIDLQGPIPTSAEKPLMIAALAGTLQAGSERPITVVNAEAEADARNIRVESNEAIYKRDFANLIRVEIGVDGTRHHACGTVLGHRHGRMIELDQYILDAIPEGPLLVTFHDNRPGVVGRIGTLLGSAQVNIDRVQLGTAADGAEDTALGIFNLDRTIDEALSDQLRGTDGVISLHTVD